MTSIIIYESRANFSSNKNFPIGDFCGYGDGIGVILVIWLIISNLVLILVILVHEMYGILNFS